MRIIVLSIALLMASCSSSPPRYYSLLNVKQPEAAYPSTGKVVGVEQVVLPKNLRGRRLFIVTDNHQVKPLSGVRWAQNLDDGLTQRLIAFLQHKFSQPAIYQYPWETSVAPDIKLTLTITRFTALEGQVYLQANWKVDNFSNTKRSTHLFNTRVATDMRVDDIVSAMNRSFAQLEAEIALTIKQY